MAESTPTLDPIARHWAMTAAAACLVPLLLQLPGQMAATVAGSLLVVALLAWRRPLPRLLRLGLVLVLVGTVLALSRFQLGRDTGCAMLAAMLAIKPSETVGLRDARSLVGFALFAPFATFLLDQGPLSLALGVAAATLALTTLQRFAELETAALQRSAACLPASSLGQRLAAVGRLLAIGLPLALAAFWLFPRLATPMWSIPDRALARPGLSGTMTPGRWVDLMSDDTPALRVRFFGDAPPTSQMYWRGPVLLDFDGWQWTQARWTRWLPPAQVKYADTVWDYQMSFEPTDHQLLVALGLPRAAPAGTYLTHAYSLHSRRPLTSVTRWRMQSSPARVFEATLPARLRRAALALPAGYNPRTLALGRRWRARAGDDDAAIVRRALDWINREFVYTLTTPLLGRHAVDEFLFDYQAGFCEHYSSAFVVLMRAAGIPARVVTGYVGGYRNPLGDYWLVRRSDAHAWAEVWMQGRGWVRVDPTAAVAPERIYDTLADRAPGAGGLLGNFAATTPLLNVADWMRRGWNDFVLGFDARRQQAMLQPLGIEQLPPARLVLLFALAAALALLWIAWLSGRGVRERDPLLRAWHALDRRYAKLGLGRVAHEPTSAWAQRVGRARPRDAAPLQRLSQRFSQWRYADPERPSGLDRGASARRGLIKALRAHRPTGKPAHRR